MELEQPPREALTRPLDPEREMAVFRDAMSGMT